MFAVGTNGIAHWDGSKWSEVNTGNQHVLRGMTGWPRGDVFVVGAQGTVLHNAWSVMSGVGS